MTTIAAIGQTSWNELLYRLVVRPAHERKFRQRVRMLDFGVQGQ
jgi:hypothetical protein